MMPSRIRFGHDEAQVAGGGGEGRVTKLSSMRRCGTAAAADEIAEALDDDAAAKHVGQARDALAVAVGIL